MKEHRIVLTQGGVALLPHSLLVFGYEGRRGVDRLHIEQRDEWQGLTLRACWHLPEGDAPATLVENGVVDVPAAVTASAGSGCITFEGSDGSRTVTSADVPFRVAANSGTGDGDLPPPGTSAWEAFVAQAYHIATDAEVEEMLSEIFD